MYFIVLSVITILTFFGGLQVLVLGTLGAQSGVGIVPFDGNWRWAVGLAFLVLSALMGRLMYRLG